MGKAKGSHWVISASFTEDGAPAYLTARRTWSRSLAEAEAFASADDKDSALAWASAHEQERIVCDPYAFPVRLEEEVIDPISARENIRAQGPTTRLRRPDPPAA